MDIGGTNIRAAVATGVTSFVDHVSLRTPAADGPDAVLDAVSDAVWAACPGGTPDGVAVGIPGPLDPDTGVVFAAPQLKGWTDVDAATRLAKLVGCHVVVHNDASLAGYAEWVAGAGKGARHMIFITASTGIGGGLVVNGELISGRAGTAGEIGHMPLGTDYPACAQGHAGCLEGTASGAAIARRAKEAIARGEKTVLAALDLALVDAAAVMRAAQAGDSVSCRLWHDAGRALGRAVGGLINLLSPEIVVIGGGLINAGELLFDPLRAGVGEIAFEVPTKQCRIVQAGLGTDAGLVGAVAWAVHSFGEG